MKLKVIIEEVQSQEFEVEVSSIDNAYDEVRQMYRDGKLVLENPSLTQANMMTIEEDGRESSWSDLHV